MASLSWTRISPGQRRYFIGLHKSSSLFKAILSLLTVYTLCFLFSNNICSLYIVLASSSQVLESSNVRPSATAHFFVPFQRFYFTFWSIFLYACIFALRATNSAMIFPPSSCFIKPITFFFFFFFDGWWPVFILVSNIFSASFAMFL